MKHEIIFPHTSFYIFRPGHNGKELLSAATFILFLPSNKRWFDVLPRFEERNDPPESAHVRGVVDEQDLVRFRGRREQAFKKEPPVYLKEKREYESF